MREGWEMAFFWLLLVIVCVGMLLAMVPVLIASIQDLKEIGNYKACPHCRADRHKDAAVCPHCGRE